VAAAEGELAVEMIGSQEPASTNFQEECGQDLIAHKALRLNAGGSRSWFFDLSNQLGLAELSTMPKSKSITGPMNTQPVGSTSTMPTPMKPAIGSSHRGAKPKQKSARTEAVRIAKAKLSRRNSLSMQRAALRGNLRDN
jgi:hypothetical protein